MYHFYPGSLWLSIGSVGCNFKCPGCHNWEIAHAIPEIKGSYWLGEDGPKRKTEYLSPEILIEIANRERVNGISYTYNEPTLWIEFAERSMALAREAGFLTNWVTNGYLTTSSIDLIGPRLDSFRVDIKGFSSETYRKLAGISDYTEILEVIKRAKTRWNMHVEIVTNIIPSVNDDMKELTALVRWIIDELGADTPWHITKYFPSFYWEEIPPTPISTLEEIYQMAKSSGLNYPYIGNVPGHKYGNTYCPSCGKVIIKRHGLKMEEMEFFGNSCPNCGNKIPGRFGSNE
jgi:pyruvate formate lyase activating enzyme